MTSISPDIVQTLKYIIQVICFGIIGGYSWDIIKKSEKIKGRESFVFLSLATTAFIWIITVVEDEELRITVGFGLLILNLIFIVKEYRKHILKFIDVNKINTQNTWDSFKNI